MEEVLLPWRDGADGERQRDMETREPDVVDAMTAAAEINHHHRGSADKHKFNTLGYQASEMGQEGEGGGSLLTLPVVEVHLFKYCASTVLSSLT